MKPDAPVTSTLVMSDVPACGQAGRRAVLGGLIRRQHEPHRFETVAPAAVIAPGRGHRPGELPPLVVPGAVGGAELDHLLGERRREVPVAEDCPLPAVAAAEAFDGGVAVAPEDLEGEEVSPLRQAGVQARDLAAPAPEEDEGVVLQRRYRPEKSTP